MKLIDLFSGIGGFSLAAHWMGWETIAFCEQDKFCQKVLRKNFDNGIPIYDDVRTFPGRAFRGADILTGGFPCQPFSAAGKRGGVNDERYLFPQSLRIIREVQPAWVVLENVNGLLSMANESWDVKVAGQPYTRSEDFDDYTAIYTRTEIMLLNCIREEIEREGYAVQPVVIPISAVGAPHERKRIWIVAHSLNDKHRAERGAVRKEESLLGINRPSVRSGRASGTDCDATDAEHEGRDDWERSETGRSDNGNGRTSTPRSDGGIGRLRSDVEPNGSATSDTSDARASRWNGIEGNDASPGRRRSDKPRGRERVDGSGYASDATNDTANYELSTTNSSTPRLSIAGLKPRQQTADASNGTQYSNRDDRNPDCDGLQGVRNERDGTRPAGLHSWENSGWQEHWLEAATRLCRVDDGLPDRVDRLKSLGNSIGPRVALEIFRAIEATEKA